MSNPLNWAGNVLPPTNGTAQLEFPFVTNFTGEVIADLGDQFASLSFSSSDYVLVNPEDTRLNLNNLSVDSFTELGLKGLFRNASVDLGEEAQLVQINPGVTTSDFDGMITYKGTGEFAVASISGSGSITLDKGSKFNPGKKQDPGQLQAPGTITVKNTATVEIDIDEPQGGGTVTADRMTAGQGVVLEPDARLSVLLSTASFIPVAKSFTIVQNNGFDGKSGKSIPVSGQFAGQPEGSDILSEDFRHTPFRISYAGGDSNDITLTRLGQITNITSSTSNGTYTTGQSINIQIQCEQAIKLEGGALVVTLDSGAVISIPPTTLTTSTLVGTYMVQAGDTSQDLNLVSLTLASGATLRTASGNIDVALLLPPGKNLGDNRNIVVNPNSPPTISNISNASTVRNNALGPIQFTLGDTQTPAANLKLNATSSNTGLVPVSNIVFSGSGATRGVTLTPAANQTGSTTVTITVTDVGGLTASDSFTLTVLAPTPPRLEKEFSTGTDQGTHATVNLRNPNTTIRTTLTPFGATFAGGVRTASGDVTGDGVADLIAASGPGMPGAVKVFDGVTFQPIPLPETVQGGGRPFGETFTRGIIVAAGDLNADGRSDLIITAEAGGGARVRIFQSTGSGFTQRSDFIALIGGDNVPDSKIFRGGSRATVSDINGDGIGDLIWAAGAGGGPRIATFNGSLLNGGSNVLFKLTGDFFALGTHLRDGAYIAGGDVNGDGIGDLIAGGGSGAPPQVVGYSGTMLTQNQFTRFVDFQYGTDSGQGIRVAVKDLNNDAVGDVIVGSAPGAGSRIAAFNGKNLAGAATGTAFFDFTSFPGFAGGLFVG